MFTMSFIIIILNYSLKLHIFLILSYLGAKICFCSFKKGASDWYYSKLCLYQSCIFNLVFLLSIDSLREAAKGWEGSPQCHPIQSSTHDTR